MKGFSAKEARSISPRRAVGPRIWGIWVALALGLTVAGEGSAQSTRGMPEDFTYEPRDLTRELANTMTGTFTVTAVGDVLMQEPMSKLMSPELVDILRESDTTVGNMEVYLVDRLTWTHGFGNNWSPKEMARDYADMGFDLLVSGEGQGGEPGMRSSIRYLDEVGIRLAGYGANLAAARQPAIQHLTKGRVALIAAYPPLEGEDADFAQGTSGESYGLNPMRLRRWAVVGPEHFAQLKGIRDAIVARRHDPDVSRPIRAPEDLPDRVQVFDYGFMLGSETGPYRYEVNPRDRMGNILAVRNAKEYSDFVMFAMHAHQNRYAFQAYSQDNYPGQWQIDLLHEMVDNGMDMYVGSGNHTMQGIEIYKGRPIFYNFGNFSVHRFGADFSGDDGPMTVIERDELANQWLQQEPNERAFAARVRYEEGILREVRIYPVDLGGAPGPERRTWSRTDVPMTPSPELAREILAQVQEYSRPFRTDISIEVDELGRPIGIIRVPASATVPVGQGIRDSFRGGGEASPR